MEILAKLLLVLMVLSPGCALFALLILQSRARGTARACIILGSLLAIVPVMIASLSPFEYRSVTNILVATVAFNLGIIILSVGLIFFSLSLPSRRTELSPDDKRPISNQILQEMKQTEE